jgi:tetratricopeptide (TPR) repeat protein
LGEALSAELQPASIAPTVAELRSDGFAALQRKDADAAESVYRELLGRDPDDIYGLVGLGLAANLRDRPEEAIALFQAAAAAKPRHPWPMLELGTLFHARGRIEEAEQALRRAVELDPRHYQVVMALGDFLAQRGRLPEAAEHYRTAASLAPPGANAYLALASILTHMGDFSAAQQAIAELLTKDGASFDGHMALGRLKLAMNDQAGARQAFQRAAEIDPNKPQPHVQIALDELACGNHDAAAAALEAALDLIPGRRDGAAKERGSVEEGNQRSLLMRERPIRHSGFQAVQEEIDEEGTRSWRCVPQIDDALRTHVAQAAELEPAIDERLLTHSLLHNSSGPVRASELSYISAVRSSARCNCLVVSESALDPGQVGLLLTAPSPLVTSARPWLTLMSSRPSSLVYWHRTNGRRREIAYQPRPAALGAAFFATVLTASMPDQHVVTADGLGLALLRGYGQRLFAASPKMTLFGGDFPLQAQDMAFLREFIAMNFASFHALIGRREFFRALGVSGEAERAPFAPRLVFVDRPDGARANAERPLPDPEPRAP